MIVSDGLQYPVDGCLVVAPAWLERLRYPVEQQQSRCPFRGHDRDPAVTDERAELFWCAAEDRVHTADYHRDRLITAIGFWLEIT
jgi:hypothetical protein